MRTRVADYDIARVERSAGEVAAHSIRREHAAVAAALTAFAVSRC
jgi:hypothetical protein